MPGSLTLADPTSLRAWQRLALERLAGWRDGPFLISAAPGAGKTRPALELAKRLLAGREVGRIAVLCPTTPLTRQWASSACSWRPTPRVRGRRATSTAWP
jgi:superfamily II DNA or RNA helicase